MEKGIISICLHFVTNLNPTVNYSFAPFYYNANVNAAMPFTRIFILNKPSKKRLALSRKYVAREISCTSTLITR